MTSKIWGRTAILGTAFALTIALSACSASGTSSNPTTGADADRKSVV